MKQFCMVSGDGVLCSVNPRCCRSRVGGDGHAQPLPPDSSLPFSAAPASKMKPKHQLRDYRDYRELLLSPRAKPCSFVLLLLWAVNIFQGQTCFVLLQPTL